MLTYSLWNILQLDFQIAFLNIKVMRAFSSYMYQTQPILTLTVHWIILIKTEQIKVQNYTTEYTEKACLVFIKYFKICTTKSVDEASNVTHGKHIFFNTT
jgi:hypothetical protein